MGNTSRAQPGTTLSRPTCPACGADVSPADVFCECGAILLPEAERKRLTGPRGWLGLFCLFAMVATPGMTAVALVSVVGSAGAAVFSPRVIGIVLLLAAPPIYGLLAGNALMRLRPAGVYHAKLYLLSRVVAAAGLFVVTGVVSDAGSGARETADLVRVLIGSALWAMYFGASRRVLVTYGAEAARRRIALRHAALVVAPVALIVLASAWWARANHVDPSGPWVLYSPANSGMSISFPKHPTQAKTAAGPGEPSALRHAAHVTAGGAGLSVMGYDFTSAFGNLRPQQLLEGLRDAAVETLGGTLVDSRPLSVAGVPGLEFTARAKTVAVRGRVFVRGSKAVVLVTVTGISPSAGAVTISERFLSSYEPR